MRTTLNLQDELMLEVKRRAVESGSSITEVIEQALRDALHPPTLSPRRFRLRWTAVDGKTLPGVDLTDRGALYEIMEGRR